MDERFDPVLLQGWATPIFPVIRREVELPRVPAKVDAIVGMRRVGKTSLCFGLMNALVDRGTPRDRIVYVNFEDDRLGDVGVADLRGLVDAVGRLAPGPPGIERWYFLDEIQTVRGWERFVRRLVDTPGSHIVVTGSSSKLLSTEIATAMRGRSLATELLPYSFREALVAHGLPIPPNLPPDESTRGVLEHAFARYLESGGFPEVQKLEARIRDAVLRDYVDVVVLRDVIERHGVTNVAALRLLVRRLLGAPGQPFSIAKFANDAKSANVAVSREHVHALVEHLHDAFLVFPVPIATDSAQKRAVNPPHVYPIDVALAAGHARARSPDLGWRLESLVYLELRRRGYTLEWARTRSGYEVDFVARRPGEEPLLVQVAWTLSGLATRERELRAIEQAAEELDIRRALVITHLERERFRRGSCEVDVRPAWWWFAERAA